MIEFHNWQLTADPFLGRQFDHLTQRLEVTGDLPEGWSWEMLVQMEDAMEVIVLEASGSGVGADLTATQLGLSGCYSMQLRGKQGELVRHTNVVTVFVSGSLSADKQWPVLPTEFTKLEQRLRSINAHPPMAGENGYWMLWNPDVEEYELSGFLTPDGGYYVPALDAEGVLRFTASKLGMPEVPGASVRGPKGDKGDVGQTGPRGPQGEVGPRGETGPQGLQGEKGDRGETGAVVVPTVDQNGWMHFAVTDQAAVSEAVYVRGPQGEQGARGETGAQGPQGIQGVPGEQGIQGDPGPKGEKGDKGDIGLAIVPSVDENGMMSFAVTDEATAPSPVNVRGPRGIQGEQGPQGPVGRSAYQQAADAGYGETEEVFSQSLSKLPNHLADLGNPHGVTAEQTGAAAAVHAVRHAHNGEDPVTADMIGAETRPNLLDNWYLLDPINQRGATEYSNGGYAIDRWIGYNAPKLTLVKDGLLISRTGQTGELVNTLAQYVEYPDTLAGKTVTLSALFTDVNGDYSIAFNDGETVYGGTQLTSAGLSTVTFTLGDTLGKAFVWVACRTMGNSSAKLAAVKLEIGEGQTLAKQDADGNWVLLDPPPNRALELAKCQRYQFSYSASGGHLLGTGVAASATTIHFFVPLPTTLRGSPAVRHSGLRAMINANSSLEIIALTAYAPTRNGVWLVATVAGATEGAAYLLRSAGEATLLLDANL